jgi:hypothetical protein
MAFKVFDRLFSFFHRRGGEKGAKGHLLKQLAKDLAANHFARFYKPRLMEVQPAAGKFFYDLYKALSHAQVFLQNASKSAQLKQITVETFLDMKHLDARQRLNAEYVERRAKTMSIIEVSHLLKEDLNLLSEAFDADFTSKVDRCYNQILSLVHLAGFDYFLFLRKFDPNLLERNFNLTPQFRPVRGPMVVEEIKDFLEIFYPFDTGMDWTLPLRILKVYKNGLDVVTAAEWSKLLNNLRELRRSSVLELLIRHIGQDPGWEFKPRLTMEHIAAAYLEDRRREVDQALTGFLSSQRQNQVSSLARELFGDPDTKWLQCYTEKDSETLVALGLEGFVHAQGLNYFKGFLVNFFEPDIRNLCETLLVRGLWSSMDRSKEMSDTFHNLLDITGRLSTLEQSLSENGEDGARLRTALVKPGRNRGHLRNLEFTIQRINRDVRDLLNASAEALIQLGGHFKEILLDVKNEGNLIKNYRELQKDAGPSLSPHIILVYKRIYTYLQIQQLLFGTDDTSLDPLSA